MRKNEEEQGRILLRCGKSVILGGGVMEQPYILGQVRERTAGRIMDSFRGVELKTAALGNQAGLMGASWMAMEQMKKT